MENEFQEKNTRRHFTLFRQTKKKASSLSVARSNLLSPTTCPSYACPLGLTASLPAAPAVLCAAGVGAGELDAKRRGEKGERPCPCFAFFSSSSFLRKLPLTFFEKKKLFFPFSFLPALPLSLLRFSPSSSSRSAQTSIVCRHQSSSSSFFGAGSSSSSSFERHGRRPSR